MNGRGELRVPVAALGVAMAALAVYVLALGNDFAYDDIPILLGDPRLKAPLDLRAIFSGGYWQNADLALYRPITSLSFALDWALAPASPAWFHLSNMVLHAGASVLVFLLLTRTFPTTAALIGGLLFAVHPVHVEAVANVVGRAELLAAVFTFGACLTWLRRTGWRTATTATFFALALLSKESAVMLPALLLLLDGAMGERFQGGIRGYARTYGPRLLVLAAVAAAYVVLRAAVLGGLTPGRVDPALEMAAGNARIFTALQAWPQFARLLFFPATLLADYGPRVLLPAQSLNGTAAFGLMLVAITVAGGLAAFAAGARRTGAGLLWFPVAVFPVSNLLVPIGVLVAERTLYVPSFALSMGAAGLAVALARAPASLQRPASILAATILALLAGRSVLRTPDWKNTEAIMAAQLRDRPDSFRGYWFAARFMRAAGDPVAAGAAFDRAIALWPHREALVVEAAAHAVQSGQKERVAVLGGMLVSQWPDNVAGYQLLAGFALDAGDPAAAERAITDGLKRAPRDPLLLQLAAALDSARAGPR